MKAFVFPGQGSQALGMGKSLLEKYPEYNEFYDIANDSLGYDLKSIVFGEDEQNLTLTQNAQPAILTSSFICYNHLKKMGIVPDVVAGHSLGEWTALVAAGVLPFEKAVKLVHLRGLYMSEACPPGKGGMAAVLGLSPEKISEVLQDFSDVVIANLNTPSQIVISGDKEQVEASAEPLKSAGAKRVVILNVSGPFHSPLVKNAELRMQEELNNIDFLTPEFAIVQNFDARFEKNPERIKEKLIKQITSSVRWVETVEEIISNGIYDFVETGHGRVLSSLIKSVKKEKNISEEIAVDNFDKCFKNEIS